MARTQKQQITHAAQIIRDWSPEGTVVELEHSLLILNDIPRGKYKDQWDQLRAALNENDDLSEPAIRNNLKRTDFARKGYWWWNPAEW